MKILFIAPLPPPTTGQSLACQALYDALDELGYVTSVINLSKNSFRQGISSIKRIREIVYLVLRTALLGRSANLVYFTPAESLAGNLKDLLLMAVLGNRLRSTYLHLHGGAGMRVLLSDRHPWLRCVNAWFLRRVAGVIVLGQRHVDIYSALMSPERIHVVKNFAPDELFASTDELTEKWANTAVLQVLFLSNLLPGKGYMELVQAIERLPPDIAARFQFSFAGGFESDAAKQSFLKTIQNLPSVRYHGTVLGAEKRELLRQAHVFCLPTFYPYEGQPISILEAYASGCAVLTTDHSGIFDIFTPGKNGLEVRPRDPESVLDALLALIAHPQQGASFALQNSADAVLLYKQRAHLQQMFKVLGLSD